MDYGMDYQGGGGGGGFGGGGFDNGGYGGNSGGNNMGRTPTSAGGRSSDGSATRRDYDEQSLRAVTVSMCLTSVPDSDGGGSSGDRLADGRKVHQVKIVGAVRAVQEFSTNNLYEIEDGTGLIDVKQWTSAEDCQALVNMRQTCLKEHIYLAIVGQIKDYDGKKTILADWVRPLTTGNEITHHMLDVVYSAETYKRQNSYGQPFMQQQQQPYGNTMNRNSGVGFGGGAATVQPFGGSNNADDDAKEAVRKWIAENGKYSEAGVHITSCIAALQRQYSEHDVRKYIEMLTSEGQIYTSIDEFHYKFAF